jgi:two-component system CheB/CheR fusion protein
LWINADAGRISQVLGNLLNNASKYTPQGGSISLNVDQEGDYLTFRVRDTGVGLPEGMLVRVFDLFAQGDHSPNSFNDGLGVGLTLVRRLVELHGGSVEAVSAGPNQGSGFIVRLPILHEGGSPFSESAHPLMEPALAPPGSRILIVDDNKDAAQSLALLLQDSGFEVKTVYKASEVFETISEFCPCAVLLDIAMPIMDGYEIARRLRTQPSGEQLTIIATTGYGQQQDEQRAMESGFDCHMTKPINRNFKRGSPVA